MCLAWRSTTSPASWRTASRDDGAFDQSRGAENRGQRVAQLVRQHRQELLAALDAFLDLLFGLPPLGDIEERHHRADQLAFSHDRMAPVLGGKARAVRPPQHLVVDMRFLPMAHRLVDRRLLWRIRRPVAFGVVDEGMQLFPDQGGRRVVAEEARARWIAEDADATQIDAVDRFRGGIEQQTDPLFPLGDFPSRPHQLRDVPRDRRHADRRFRTVEDGRELDRDVDQRSVLATKSRLHSLDRAAAAHL